jgi:hypothetical protein
MIGEPVTGSAEPRPARSESPWVGSGVREDRGRAFGALAIAFAVASLLVVSAGPEALAQDGADCTRTYVAGLTPLTDLGTASYLGAQGGLYPGGVNLVPDEHLELGLQLAGDVDPLNGNGQEDATAGKVGLISIGVSNTSAEFQAFADLAAERGNLDPHLVLVNGAQSGAALTDWADEDEPWDRLAGKVSAAGLTPSQVQAAWIKLPSRETELPGSFPDDAEVQQDLLAEILRMVRERYPNTKIAYMSSRIYGGYGSELSPEPVAYQHGFAVKWVIEDQIQGSGNLNANPEKGPVVAPWVSWGPYLWANGLGSDGKVGGIPGRSDGLEWLCADFGSDGIHPTETGEAKVAEMLLDHFSTDPTACSWFLASSVCDGEISSGTGVEFEDIEASLFEDEILWLLAEGITNGCSVDPPLFCPDAHVTRGQMAAFLDRALDLPDGPDRFGDDDDSIFEANINAIARAGITLGCNQAGTLFCPDGLVTRGQMAAFLFRASPFFE